MSQDLTETLRRKINRIANLFRKDSKKEQFIVNCAGCHRDIPIGVSEFPFQSISMVCSLCGSSHRYRPSQIGFGVPAELVRPRREPHASPVGSNGRPALIRLSR